MQTCVLEMAGASSFAVVAAAVLLAIARVASLSSLQMLCRNSGSVCGCPCDARCALAELLAQRVTLARRLAVLARSYVCASDAGAVAGRIAMTHDCTACR